MADLDQGDVGGRGAHFSENGDETVAGLLSPRYEARKTVEREGLPPGFRMRADAHYVDQLSARSSDVPMRLIPIDDIDVDEPVPSGEPGALQPLVQSIAEHGILQPLLVRREGARYQLLSGRKRLAAARSASLGRVPCLVHAVDEPEAAALARAASVTTEPQNVAAASTAVAAAHAHVIADVTDLIATIQSASTLVADDGSPLVRRVALDLVRSATWRAAWQLSAAAILGRTHSWRFRPALLGNLLVRVRDGFTAESRLKGIELSLRVDDWNLAADLDEAAVVAGVSGAVVAAAGLTPAGEGPQLAMRLRHTDDGALGVEITHDAAVWDAPAGRFFDLTWSDRPGGKAAALGAAVARAVAERHGGTAACIVSPDHAVTIRLTLGRAPATATTARH